MNSRQYFLSCVPRNFSKNIRPLFRNLFLENTAFRDENPKIWDRFKVKAFSFLKNTTF